MWNEQTGHLVGGHQRLSLVDELEGGHPYTIGVAVINVPPGREMEINVALNNEQLRGDFDPEKFFALLTSEHAPTIAGMGFTRADLEMEFGPGPDVDAVFGTATAAPADGRELVPDDEQPDEAEPEDEHVASAATMPQADPETYVLVAFPTWTVKERFLMSLERAGDLRMMAGDEFASYVRE